MAQSLLLAGQDAMRSELLPGGLDANYEGEGFLFGLALNGVYDSNLFLSDGSEESDYTITVSPWVHFRSAPPGGARTILTTRYAPFIRTFLSNDDLNALDHSGNAGLTYEGVRGTVGINAAYSRITQANRFAGGRIENELFTIGAMAAYEISDKTSLEAMVRAGNSSQGIADTTTVTSELSALWQATPLIKVGPTIRYAHRDAATLDDVESVGLLLTADYEASALVRVRASAGVERAMFSMKDDETGLTGSLGGTYGAPELPWSLAGEVTYGRVQQLTSGNREGAGGDAPVSGRLALTYAIAELWSATLDARYETIPSPTLAGESFDEFSFSVAVTRAIGVGSLGGGVVLGFSDSEAGAGGFGAGGGGDYFSSYLSYQLGLWDDRIHLDSSLRYSANQGARDWSRVQFSIGLSYTF